MAKSTIQTSRKIYAMEYGLKFVAMVTLTYVAGKALGAELDSNVFVSAIGAAGLIIGALNIADGMKGNEDADG